MNRERLAWFSGALAGLATWSLYDQLWLLAAIFLVGSLALHLLAGDGNG